MDIHLDIFTLGPLGTNCYLIRCGASAAVVDPGMGPDELLTFIERHHAEPQTVLLTHGHGDHIAGIAPLKKRYPSLRVICPAADAPMLVDAAKNLSSMFGLPLAIGPADELIQPGQNIQIGQSEWQVLDTSGHTPGGVSYYCQALDVAITGDALFAGSIGRTDVPDGDQDRLIANIRAQLLSLPDHTQVLPGHGPSTTIGQERIENPYLA